MTFLRPTARARAGFFTNEHVFVPGPVRPAHLKNASEFYVRCIFFERLQTHCGAWLRWNQHA